MVSGTKTAARDVSGEIAYLTRALKAPTLRESAGRLAERARAESWSHGSFEHGRDSRGKSAAPRFDHGRPPRCPRTRLGPGPGRRG